MMDAYGHGAGFVGYPAHDLAHCGSFGVVVLALHRESRRYSVDRDLAETHTEFVPESRIKSLELRKKGADAIKRGEVRRRTICCIQERFASAVPSSFGSSSDCCGAQLCSLCGAFSESSHSEAKLTLSSDLN